MSLSGFLNTGVLAVCFDPNSTVYAVLLSVFLLVSIVGGYLLGSINTAIIVSRVFYHDDIRRHGSGNAGLTNTLRTYGGKAALLTLFGDMLKTALTIAIAGVLLGFQYVTPGAVSISPACYLAGLFAVLGHVFPIYYRMKGGKGVLATATMALILSPAVFGVLFLLFVGVVAISKFVSLGSVTVAMLYPVALNAYVQILYGGARINFFMALSSIVLAILLVWCHRENLKRISDRTERKLSFRKKKPEDEADGKDA